MGTILPAKTKGPWPARWMPFALLETLQGEVERVLWPYGFGRPGLRDSLLRGVRMSQTDIFQQGGDLLVSVELPGIKKEDISVALLQGELIIQGESREDEEESARSYYWRERHSRSYYRRVRLPFEAQPDTITAKYADGVLEVRVPSPAVPPPATQSIEVQ